MNEQIKDLALRTGEVIFNAVGNDADALSSVLLYIASSIGDKVTQDTNYLDGIRFFAQSMDKIDKVGRLAVTSLTPEELEQLV